MAVSLRWLVVASLVAVVGCGTRGRVYIPGNDVTLPILVTSVRPSYTYDAMAAKIEGHVLLSCVVEPDGAVGEIEITRSLDSTHGLDTQAIATVRQWRFKPGMRNGQPVPVRVPVDIEFTLRSQ